MKSWREKIGGWGKQLKETASSKLSEAREAAKVTAEKALNTITSISGEVRSKVQEAVGEIMEPVATATAVTGDGQMCAVAVDAGTHNHIPNYSSPAVQQPAESPEDEERRELKKLKKKISTNVFIDAFNGQMEFWKSGWSGLSDLVRWNKSQEPLVQQWTECLDEEDAKAQMEYNNGLQDWDDVFADFSDGAMHSVERPSAVKTRHQYAPTLLNVHMEGLDGSEAKPKRRRTPPKGTLRTSADTIKAQGEAIKQKAAERQAKKKGSGSGGGNGNKGPEKKSSRNKWALLAGALTTIAGYLAIDSVSDYMDSTSTAPTASAKAPEKKVAPTPAPSQTEEQKTVEVPQPVPTTQDNIVDVEELKQPEPQKVVVNDTKKNQYAKRRDLPKKDPIVDTEPPKEPETVAVTPTSTPMELDDASRVSDDLREIYAQLNFAAGDTDLGQRSAIYDYTDSFTGTTTRQFMTDMEPAKRGSILLYLATAEKLRKTYDANQDCLNPEADKTGLKCDGEHTWTIENAETLTEAAYAANRVTEMEKERKQNDTIGAQLDTLKGLEMIIERTIANIQDADSKYQILNRFHTLQARIAVAKKRGSQNFENPADTLNANESYSNRLRLMITRAEALRQDAQRMVIKSHGYKKKPAETDTKKVAHVKRLPSSTPYQPSQKDQELMNWIPESI